MKYFKKYLKWLLGIIAILCFILLGLGLFVQLSFNEAKDRADKFCLNVPPPGSDLSMVSEFAQKSSIDSALIYSDKDEVKGFIKKGGDFTQMSNLISDGRISVVFHSKGPETIGCSIMVKNHQVNEVVYRFKK